MSKGDLTESPKKYWRTNGITNRPSCISLLLSLLIKENSAQPAYIYNFAHLPNWKPANQSKVAKTVQKCLLKKAGLTLERGSMQGDELPFIFKLKLFGFTDQFFLKSSTDLEISKKMVKLLVNFAKDSNPTPQGTLTTISYRIPAFPHSRTHRNL